MTKAYQAYGSGSTATADTPKNAARTFFEKYPTKRKCDIIEGEDDGRFFTVRYGRASAGEYPTSYKNVTKKTLETLPF